MLLLHNRQTKQEAAVGANVSVVSQGAQKPLVWEEAGPAAALLFRRALPGCTACAQRGIFFHYAAFSGERAGGRRRAG